MAPGPPSERARNHHELDSRLAKDPARLSGLRPLELFVEISTHCNLRCPHCPRESDEGILSGRTVAHLKTDWFPKLAEAMRFANVVHACGLGEPTLHHGLEDLAKHAREAGHALAIRTNGVRLSPERVASLAAAGVGEIHVSIDGGTPETFARLRTPADPVRVLSNLAYAAGARRMAVTVHTMLAPETLGELPALIDELARVGVRRVTASPRRGAAVSTHDLAPARERAALGSVHFEVAEAAPGPVLPNESAGPGLLGDLPATSRVRGLERGTIPVRALCSRPFTTAYVAADGRIGACENGLHRLGSIATQSVEEAFAGRAFEELREKMIAGVVPPECRACVRLGWNDPPDASFRALASAPPTLCELSAPGEARVRALPEFAVEVSPVVRKKGAKTVAFDALVRLRAERPRRIRVALEWRAGDAREWLAPPRLEEVPAGFVQDVHLDAPIPPALDGKDGLALRLLVEDAATGRVLVDETHPVTTKVGASPDRPPSP